MYTYRNFYEYSGGLEVSTRRKTGFYLSGRPRFAFVFVMRDDDGPWAVCRAAAEVPAGQMTIFYDGKINVYDGVVPDKVK